MTISSLNNELIQTQAARNPVGYLNGLQAVNDTALVINIQPGSCSDQMNRIDIVVETAITVNAGVEGVNGLDAAVTTLVNDAPMYVYVIADSRGINQPAGLVSASTSPALPFGYDTGRLVDIKILDGTHANFLITTTTGNGADRKICFDTPLALVSAVSTITAWTQVDLKIPTLGTAPILDLAVSITPVASTGAGDEVALRPMGSTVATGYASLSGSVAAVKQTGMIVMPAGIDTGVTSIEYLPTDTGDTTSISLLAFTASLDLSAAQL